MPKSKAKKVSSPNKELAELRAKVTAQEKIINNYEKMNQKTKKSKQKSGKTLIAWLSISLAAALLVAGNLFFWAGNTIVDTDRYVRTVGPLIEEPEVQAAVADYTATQLFNTVDVQAYVMSVLPPKAELLAPQLTSQLKTYTETSIKTLLANEKVQDYWYSSLERRHDAIINFAKNYQGDGTIEVSDIFNQLGQRLADTRLSFLADKQLPENVGSIQVATAGWLPVLSKVSNNIGTYQAVTTSLFVLLTAAGIYMAKKRRNMAIKVAVVYSLVMLFTLVSIRILGSMIVSKTNQAYQSAVSVSYATVTNQLVLQTRAILLLALLLGLIAWLSGSSKSASRLKKRVNMLLSGKLHQALFGNRENALTLWVGAHKRTVQWVSVVGIAIVMLIVQLSPKLVILYGLLILLLVLIAETLAAPAKKKA